MSARDKIFDALKDRRQTPSFFPVPKVSHSVFDDLAAVFGQNVKAAGGEAVMLKNPYRDEIVKYFPKEGEVVDTREEVSSIPYKDEIDLTIIEAEFGVAENGAVWIDPKERYPREFLTLSENIAVVLKKDAIVDTMHEAYGRIDLFGVSYALFMAGPSKTADIEQALVVGAHGAMCMKVFLY